MVIRNLFHFFAVSPPKEIGVDILVKDAIATATLQGVFHSVHQTGYRNASIAWYGEVALRIIFKDIRYPEESHYHACLNEPAREDRIERSVSI